MDRGRECVSQSIDRMPEEVNQDEQIMAQQKNIDREIAENSPLVGPLITMEDIFTEYPEDEVIYRNKIKVSNVI